MLDSVYLVKLGCFQDCSGIHWRTTAIHSGHATWRCEEVRTMTFGAFPKHIWLGLSSPTPLQRSPQLTPVAQRRCTNSLKCSGFILNTQHTASHTYANPLCIERPSSSSCCIYATDLGDSLYWFEHMMTPVTNRSKYAGLCDDGWNSCSVCLGISFSDNEERGLYE